MKSSSKLKAIFWDGNGIIVNIDLPTILSLSGNLTATFLRSPHREVMQAAAHHAKIAALGGLVLSRNSFWFN
jgi:hypothetical protein